MNAKASEDSVIDSLIGQWLRRKWLFIGCVVAVISIATSLIITMPALYRSSTTILFGQGHITESLVKVATSNELEMRLGVIQQAVLSRTQLQQVIDKFNLYQSWKDKAPPEWLIERMRKDIKIEKRTSAQPQWGQNSTYAITITYQGWDAEIVADVANDIASRFRAENERIRISQAARTTEFIRDQLDEAKEIFITQERQINAFRNEHMGELPEQQQLNLSTLERLNSDLRVNRERQLQILKERDTIVSGATENPEMSATLRLRRLQSELASLRSSYKESHPGILRLKNEIRSLKLELGLDPNIDESMAGGTAINPDKMDRDLSRLKQEERRLDRSIAAIMQRIESTPKIDQQLKRFAYDYESAKEKYLSLQKKYQDAQLAESLESQQNQQIRVIEVAIPAAFPIAPNKMGLLLVTAFIAFGLGGNAVFMSEQMDRSFHTANSIRQFTNVPVMATIATIATTRDRLRSAARATCIAICFVIVVVALSVMAYQSGHDAQSMVWMLSS